MAHPSAGGFSSQAAVVLGTSIAAFLSGFALGIYSIRGYLLVSPSLEAQRRAQVTDPVESEASDIEVDDDMARQQLSHAPNWANRRDADRRDGLVAEGTRTPTGTATPDRLRVPDREQGGSRLSRESSASELRQRQPSPSSPATLAQMNEECKLVLVVRTDLGMTKGKIAAQCSHATLACYKVLLRAAQRSPSSPEASILRRWERHGQAKIAVQCKGGEEELETLRAIAHSLGVTAEVIADAGRTQIEAGSLTVLGVGPAPKSVVDKVTGHLKLL